MLRPFFFFFSRFALYLLLDSVHLEISNIATYRTNNTSEHIKSYHNTQAYSQAIVSFSRAFNSVPLRTAPVDTSTGLCEIEQH